MTEFEIWFPWGIIHILDIKGLDHILFIALLTLSFPIQEWKKLIGLITAFTIGHSVTLALSTLSFISIKREYCELLIALTILSTAFMLYFSDKNTPKRGMYLYPLICCFGLIHGLGFSSVIKEVEPTENVLKDLFYFNCGIEVGQIIMVVFILVISLFLTKVLKINFNFIQKAFAVVAGIASLGMCIQRIIDIYNS